MFHLSKTCRLCMHGITEGTRSQSCLRDDIRKLIKKIHGFEVKSDDNRPKFMCLECYQKLQHFSMYLDMVKRSQRDINKLIAVEQETTKVKIEPEEIEPAIIPVAAELSESQLSEAESGSTLSNISERCLEELVNLSHKNRRDNSQDCTSQKSKDQNERPSVKDNTEVENNTNEDPSIESPRRSRSVTRSSKNIDTPSTKRKRDKSQHKETSRKNTKKARSVKFDSVEDGPSKRSESEVVANSLSSSETPRTKKNSKEPIASTSTPLRVKNDQSSIMKFFKLEKKCDKCGIVTNNSALLNFHEQFHSTLQCPGCDLKYVKEDTYDINEHYPCFWLKNKFTKEQLQRMNSMRVNLTKLTDDQIRNDVTKLSDKKSESKMNEPNNSVNSDRKRSKSLKQMEEKSKEIKPNEKIRTPNKRKSGNDHNDSSRGTDRSDAKKIKRKSKKSSKKASLDESTEDVELGNVSIALNWYAELPKEKVFWIRNFATNAPTYVSIRPKQNIDSFEAHDRLVAKIKKIDEYAKKAEDTPTKIINSMTQNQSNRPVPRERSASVYNPVSFINKSHENARHFIPNHQLSRFPPGVSTIIPNNNGLISCERQSMLYDMNNQSSSMNNPTAPRVAGLIRARRKSVATDTIRKSMSSNYNQVLASTNQPQRRNSVCLDRPPQTIEEINEYYQRNAPAIVPNTSSVPLRSITVNHSYTNVAQQRQQQQQQPQQQQQQPQLQQPQVQQQPQQQQQQQQQQQLLLLQQKQPQLQLQQQLQQQPQQQQQQQNVQQNLSVSTVLRSPSDGLRLLTQSRVGSKVTYTLEPIDSTRKPVEQSAIRASVLPVNGSVLNQQPIIDTQIASTSMATSLNSRQLSQPSQSTTQPKPGHIKVLSVADLNARLPTGNTQPSAQAGTSFLTNIISGFQMPKPRMKLTPLRPTTTPTPPDKQTNNQQTISVSLSKINDGKIELAFSIHNNRIEYESLSAQQKEDVQQCLLKEDIWRDMLGHIKNGIPTKETLILFKKILPPRERAEFFQTYNS